MTDKSQFDELSAKVNSLTDSLKKLTEALPELISNAVKPLVEAQDEIKANQEAKDKVEFDGLVEKIIKASILDEETAKELTLNSARKLAEKAKPGKAAPVVVGNFGGKEDDEWAGYDMNTNFKKEEAI